MSNILETIHGSSLNDLLLLSDLWLPVNLRPPARFLDGLSRQDLTDALKACLLVFSLSSCSIVPHEFQLAGSLETVNGRDSVVISGTGSGKTLLIIIPLLLRPKSVAITVSPLKRLQTSQVSEFEKWGIRTKTINSDTPKDKSLWEDITHGHYQHLIVSAEQLSMSGGHVSRFSHVLNDKKFRKHLAHVNIDEVHNIWTAGIKKHGREPFRPAWGKLGEARVKLPKSVSLQAMSATLPDAVLDVVRQSLSINDSAAVLRLSANRRNITYATLPLLGGDIRDYRNLNCIIPTSYHPPMVHIPKVIIFHDSKTEAADVAIYLDRRLPRNLQGAGIVQHYHSSMSDIYLEDVYLDFSSPNSVCRVLCATSGVSTGLNVLDVDIVIQYGLCTDLLEGIQRAGRAGRDGVSTSLFLVFAESWVSDLELDDEDSRVSALPSRDFDAPPKSVAKLPGKRSQIGSNAIKFVRSESCLRSYIATFLGDMATDALVYTNRWCCDRHDDDFNLQTLLPARIFHNDSIDNPPAMKPPKRKRAKLRTPNDRKLLTKELKRWRLQTNSKEIGAAFRPVTWILDDDGLKDLAKIHPTLLKCPADVVATLNQSNEWSRCWSTQVFDIIQAFDRKSVTEEEVSLPVGSNEEPLPARAKRRKLLKKPVLVDHTNIT